MNKIFFRITMLIVLSALLLSMKPASKLNVYLFLQAECPCVYSHKDSFGKLLRQYSDRVNFLVVFSGKNDKKDQMENLLKQLNWNVKYIKDNDQKLVKQLKPSVSTDCVVFDKQNHTIYNGAIDDGVGNMGMIKRFYLKEIIDAFLNDQPVPFSSKPGFGCTLKY